MERRKYDTEAERDALVPALRDVSRQEYLKKREEGKLEELRQALEDEEALFAVRPLWNSLGAAAGRGPGRASWHRRDLQLGQFHVKVHEERVGFWRKVARRRQQAGSQDVLRRGGHAQQRLLEAVEEPSIAPRVLRRQCAGARARGARSESEQDGGAFRNPNYNLRH